MNKKILIIGGMGPQASINLHTQLINDAAANGARDGKDYPSILHVSIPVEDFINNPRKKDKALFLIKSSLESLW